SAECLSVTDQIHSGLTQRLDRLIDSGQLFTENAGPRLKGRLVLHGCKGYSHDQREALLAQHTQTCAALDEMIKAAAHGQPISGHEIARVVAVYLTGMMNDVDCILDVA